MCHYNNQPVYSSYATLFNLSQGGPFVTLCKGSYMSGQLHLTWRFLKIDMGHERYSDMDIFLIVQQHGLFFNSTGDNVSIEQETSDILKLTGDI